MKYLALLLLSGCAIFPPDYRWVKQFPAATSYEWHVKPQNTFHQYCGSPLKWDTWACAVQIQESGKCFIFSNVTEEAARHIWTGGGDDTPMLREHELKHCAGWTHQILTR